jgi:hypothetical protein
MDIRGFFMGNEKIRLFECMKNKNALMKGHL